MKPHLRFLRARSPSLYPTTTSILIRYRTESTRNPSEKLLNLRRFLQPYHELVEWLLVAPRL